MNVKSVITGKIYDPDKVWYVANMEQIDAYNSNGAENRVMDVLYSNKNHRFIFVYQKDEFMDLLYEKWKKHELKRDEGRK